MTESKNQAVLGHVEHKGYPAGPAGVQRGVTDGTRYERGTPIKIVPG